MHIKLRPSFSFEDVLRTSWHIFTKDPAPFLVPFLLISLPFLGFILFTGSSLGLSFFQTIEYHDNNIILFIFIFVLAYLIFIISSFFVPLVMAFLTEDMAHGKSADLKKAFQKSVPRFFPYLGTSIIQMIALVLLFLLLIIPGIIFSVYWMFTSSIVALRGKWGISAIQYSGQIVKGKWWKVFGYSLLFSIMIGIPIWVVSFVIQWRIEHFFIQSFILITIQILVSAFASIFYIVFFLFLEHEYTEKKAQDSSASDN